MTTEKQTKETHLMTFSGLHPFRVRVEEVGRVTQGLGSVTYKIVAVKSGHCEGYVRRIFSYNTHNDYGFYCPNPFDRSGVLLGDNLTLREAVERTICL